MAKTAEWTVVPHLGPTTESKEKITRRKRLYVPTVTPETRPEVLELIQSRIDELNTLEAIDKSNRSRTQRKHVCTENCVFFSIRGRK
jgi:hypothetical protein